MCVWVCIIIIIIISISTIVLLLLNNIKPSINMKYITCEDLPRGNNQRKEKKVSKTT